MELAFLLSAKSCSTTWYYEEKNVINGFRLVMYPLEVKRFCRMLNFGVQKGRVLPSGVRIRDLVMSSPTW